MLNNIAGVLAPTTPLVTNSYEAIQSTDVGSGGSSSITFTVIPSTFKHLQIRVSARGNNAGVNDSFAIRFNGDSGNNYTYHVLYGEGSGTPTATAVTPYSSIRGTEIAGNTAGASIFGVAVADILDYTNTSKYKTGRVLGGDDRNGSGVVGMSSGVWMNTAAITSITITPIFGSLFQQYSSFALYGIKG